ncbi:MAG: PH domain-containing protein [Candidatus Nanosalina sp.]
MFSAVDELTDSDEEVQKSVNPSKFDSKYVKTFLTGVALFLMILAGMIGNVILDAGIPQIYFLVSLILPAAMILRGEIQRRFVMYHFTDREIIEEYGVFSKDFNTIPYERIQDVSLDEEFQERIFDVGDIKVRTAGTDNSEQILNGLRDPESYKVLLTRRATQDGGSDGTQSTGTDDSDFGDFESSDEEADAGISTDLLGAELERVENQISNLDQKSNMQGLSQSEKQRWYKLEGQKELLNRLMDQSEQDSGSGFSDSDSQF